MNSKFSEKLLSERTQWLCLQMLCWTSIALGVFIRVFNLSYPNRKVFDEVHYATMANSYLLGNRVFDAHPPLGKFLIACGISILGDRSVGWRIIPMLFGICDIAVLGALFWYVAKDKYGAMIASTLIAIDGMFIVYSRLALMDGMLCCFIFTSLLLAVRDGESPPVILIGVAIGLTVSIKWTGLCVLVPVVLVFYLRGRMKQLPLVFISAAVSYLGIVAFGQFAVGSRRPIIKALRWNTMAAKFHLALTQTHSFSSPWWSWPILKKPVLLLFDRHSNETVNVMTTRGNTFIWLASTIAAIYSAVYLARLWKSQGGSAAVNHPVALFFSGYCASFLPFALVHRPLFIYMYLPPYGFAILLLAYWLGVLWKKAPIETFIYLVAALLVTLYCLPSSVGWILVPTDWIVM